MTKPLLALALLLTVPTFAPAQSADAARSDAIMKKVGELDALIQIVPLALTKEQIPPLLSAIEKVQHRQKEIYALEAADLAKIEAKLTRTVDDGADKGIYPPRTTQNEIAALMRAMGIRRTLFYNDMVDNVFVVCKATLNVGQLAVMEKSLKPEAFDPSQKGSTMDSDAKIKFYVRKVLLDPPAYDVLLQMSRRKDEPAPTPPAP